MPDQIDLEQQFKELEKLTPTDLPEDEQNMISELKKKFDELKKQLRYD